MSTHLLVIDPQNDFCDPSGALFVPGADADMDRLSRFVTARARELDAIHVSLDSHRLVDIAHPIWFRDEEGRHPAPFTLVSAADLRSGRWTTTAPEVLARTLAYLDALEAGGRYPHTIWPVHCLSGAWGHNVHPTLFEAFQGWAARHARLDLVHKGENPFSEHFSALKAEVEDPEDPSTGLNSSLLDGLRQADTILVAGEALSHCVLSTVVDLVRFAPELAGRLVLLTDTMSPVPDPPGAEGLFSGATRRALADLQARGVRTAVAA